MTADVANDDSIVSLAHVAAGVNAVPGSLHWGPRDLIAYGAGPAVFLYDQRSGRVRASMVMMSSGRKETSGGSDGASPTSSGGGRVCCVRWKGPEATEGTGKDDCCWAELASGTSDGVVATWKVRLPPPDVTEEEESESSSPSSSSCCDLLWEQTALLRLESGGAGVTSLTWHEEDEELEEGDGRLSTLVALAGTEAAVFSRRGASCSFTSPSSAASPSPWVSRQRLSLHPRLAHAAALSVLGSAKEKENRLLLAVGTVDGATLLFVGAPRSSHSSSSPDSAAPVFSPVPAAAARGHGDWVRGVALTSKSSRTKKEEEGGEGSKETAATTAAAAENNGVSSSSFSSPSSLLMATASNDRTVRVWEVSFFSSSGIKREGKGEGDGDDDDDDDNVTALAAASSSSKPSSSPSSSASSSSPSSVSVRLVATLTGHDDWVLSVDWKKKGKRRRPERPCLLSVSADRSARLWSPASFFSKKVDYNKDNTSSAEGNGTGNGNANGGGGNSEEENGLWLCDAMVGDAGSAAALGFCGGCFSPDGDGLAAASPAGAIHVWRREREEEGEGEEGEDDLSLSPLSLSRCARLLPRRWEARPSAGGHCSRVVDACWAGPDGASLLSVSEDQTARLFTWLAAPPPPALKKAGDGDKFQANVDNPDPKSKNKTRPPLSPPPPPLWAEVARPQTHGHDFSCVAAVLSGHSKGSSPALYASGSEEKVIRVFEAPRAFSRTLAWARGEAGEASDPSSAAAFGATLPALGLSNRAVHRREEGAGRGGGGGGNGDDDEDEEEAEKEEEEEESAIYPEGPDALPAAAPAALSCRPVEAALAGGTLWPEDVKLYGHGAELSALAATAGRRKGRGAGFERIGPLFASAAAAKAARWAAIRLWRKREEREGGSAAGLSSWIAAGNGNECHSLTVTRLSFREVDEEENQSSSSSPASPPPLLLLASASRDRSFAVHSVVVDAAGEGGEGAEEPRRISLETLLHQRGAHSRALTDCAWAPASSSSSSAAFLATSSRDGSVKVWSLALGGGGASNAAAELLLELPRARTPATALAFAPRCGGKVSSSSSSRSVATLAVGLGDGGVQLWTVELPLEGGGGGGAGAESVPSSFSLLWAAPAAQRHAAAVRRLCFAPRWARFGGDEREEDASLSWLGSVGDDGAVRVFRCRC